METGSDSLIELVRSARSGDREALGLLVEKLAPDLHAYVRLNAGEGLRRLESCSDLVQTVCREVVEDIGSFEGNVEAQFRRWLFTVALRKIQSRGRFYAAERRDVERMQPLGDESLKDAYRSFYTPSYRVAAQEELARVEAAFERLPPDYQEVINLCCMMGLSHREASEVLGRAETAVRKLLSRARAQLALYVARPEQPDTQ